MNNWSPHTALTRAASFHHHLEMPEPVKQGLNGLGFSYVQAGMRTSWFSECPAQYTIIKTTAWLTETRWVLFTGWASCSWDTLVAMMVLFQEDQVSLPTGKDREVSERNTEENLKGVYRGEFNILSGEYSFQTHGEVVQNRENNQIIFSLILCWFCSSSFVTFVFWTWRKFLLPPSSALCVPRWVKTHNSLWQL